MIIIDIISIIIFSYCAFYIAYYIFFTIAGRLVKPREINDYKMAPGSIAVLIPAYKEDSVIVDTVEKNLSQNYPGENWKIIVIADSLKAETVQRLQKLPIITVVVDFEISRKAKAINAALLQIPNFDYIVILDADNVMGSDFLYKVNERLSAGAVAIQGHRTAKNNENSMAVLDGISEEINNHIFRYGQTVVGLSSALIGSGMAFQFEYYKSINSGVDDIWEDRELEFRILKAGNRIEYLTDAFVYDEKVTNSHIFTNQRSKWLAGQIHYLKKYIFLNWPQILRGNIDLLNKLLQTLSPPRSIMIGLIPAFLVLSFIFSLNPPYWYWFILGVLYCLCLFLAIPTRLFTRQFARALLRLPAAIGGMFIGLLRSIRSQNISYNTPHEKKDPV